jgi:predicted phage-related endonuclease
MKIDKYPNLEFIDLPQGSPEWFEARFGSVGGSEFKTAVAKGRGGKESKTRAELMKKKIREQHTGQQETWGENHATRWGNYYEDDARMWFKERTGLQVATVGLIRNDLYQGFHTSPDGIIMTANGIYWVEIKCPQWAAACKYLEAAASLAWLHPAEYRLQCRHHSVITGAVGGFFISYYPKDKAREILGQDAEWEQVIKYVPAPGAGELAEHVEGMNAWNKDYAEMLRNLPMHP